MGGPGAAGSNTRIHSGLLAARAQRLDLFDVLRQHQKHGRSREGNASEVTAQAVADHRDISLGRQAVQLAGLIGREKLRLINKEAAHAAQVQAQKICVGVETRGFTGDPKAAGDAASTISIVDSRGHDERAQALLAVIVGYLQERGALASIHRRISEMQLCHAQARMRSRSRNA